ncbi:hypothetical protein AAG570_010481 [Ranatra chinensis]|uniref:Uncharacterized protein n=1 Tax=Ranatra chinensis TaxID=642074 RepID=A0ABD0YMN9_9HEMI
MDRRFYPSRVKARYKTYSRHYSSGQHSRNSGRPRVETTMNCWKIGSVCIFSLACILHMAPARPNVGPLKGQYILVPKQLADCPNKGTNELRLVSSKLRKIGRDTYSYTSDVILPYGLTDEMSFVFNCATHGNGGWKENAFNINFDRACTSLKKRFPETYELAKKEFGSFQDCPIPPGNYTIRNAIYKPSSLKAFPTLFYEQFRMDTYFLMDNKRIGCKRFFYDVVPKKNV